jgi:FG-GAP-like repeat
MTGNVSLYEKSFIKMLKGKEYWASIDVLGKDVARSADEVFREYFLSRGAKTSYLSLLAAVSLVTLGQTQTVAASVDTKINVPGPIKQRNATIVADLNRRCSTPELLRRQTDYRLPGQPRRFNLVDVLAGGGDNCPGVAIPAGTYTTASPFTDTGTTIGANDTVTQIQAGCSDYSQVAGPDLIYSFKISALGASPQIQLTPSNGSYDPAIYILDGSTGLACPAGVGNSVTNCLTGHDAGFAGQPETLSSAAISALPLNTQLYLFIDSFYVSVAASGAYTLTLKDITVAGATPANVQHVLDFDGDGKTDPTVTRVTNSPNSGQMRWFVYNSSTGNENETDWGLSTDKLVPADYDGDHKTDIAVWRAGPPFGSFFYILQSSTNTVRIENFGQTGDDPTVTADYTGDGKADPAVYRAGFSPGDTSFFYYKASSGQFTGQTIFTRWGQNGDTPVPGDFNGDGKADFCVRHPNPPANTQNLFLIHPGTGGGDVQNPANDFYIVYGTPTDKVVPGDYDGDGITDIALVRNVNGLMYWFVRPSSTGAQSAAPFTIFGVYATDLPVPGDYDGDGKTDPAVWRPNADPTQNYFFISGSTSGIYQFEWGMNGDYPVANYDVK